MLNSKTLGPSVMATAMMEGFKMWGSKDPKYKPVFKKLGSECFEVIGDVFSELDVYKPGIYEMWWANNHMRYRKKVSNEQARLVHELMYHFLSKYVRGELNEKGSRSRKHNGTAKASGE
jgi:hypothetical protein